MMSPVIVKCKHTAKLPLNSQLERRSNQFTLLKSICDAEPGLKEPWGLAQVKIKRKV